MAAANIPPVTKLSLLRDAAAAGDWRRAIAIAARFPRLDAAHKAAIERAHMAYTNPHFVRQTGRDVAACIAAGQAALTAAYRLG